MQQIQMCDARQALELTRLRRIIPGIFELFEPRIEQLSDDQDLWRGIRINHENDLDKSSDRNAWFCLVENRAREYAGFLGNGEGLIALILQAQMPVVGRLGIIRLRVLTQIFEPNIPIPMQIWQRDILLPTLLRCWPIENTNGFLDEETDEIWLPRNSYAYANFQILDM